MTRQEWNQFFQKVVAARVKGGEYRELRAFRQALTIVSAIKPDQTIQRLNLCVNRNAQVDSGQKTTSASATTTATTAATAAASAAASTAASTAATAAEYSGGALQEDAMVKVVVDFESSSQNKRQISAGERGYVERIDEDGDAMVIFGNVGEWVGKNNLRRRKS